MYTTILPRPTRCRAEGTTTRRTRRVRARWAQRSEQGSTLVLALIFLMLASVTVFSIATWAGNSLVDAVHFKTQASLDYALGAAVQTETQNLRYSFQPTSATPFACTPGSGSSVSLNGQAVSVFCSVVEKPLSAATRVVTLDACVYATTLTATTCVATPGLQAVVTFDDYSSSGVFGCLSASAEVSCGTAMAITSWSLAR